MNLNKRFIDSLKTMSDEELERKITSQRKIEKEHNHNGEYVNSALLLLELEEKSRQNLNTSLCLEAIGGGIPENRIKELIEFSEGINSFEEIEFLLEEITKRHKYPTRFITQI